MKGDTSGPQGVVPLRTILRNFLNLVETCEAGVKDGLDSYEKEFQELKQFSENLKSDPAYLCKEGEKNVNRKKNRYKDILPFDYTRVILGDYGDVPGSDYINANFIKGASGSSAYIACQGPLPHTVNDFWRMVVECEVQVIVMACNEQESGKHKCENYWVEEEAVERQFGQVTIWLKKCRQVCPDFLVRTMRIRYTNTKGEIEERNVCQFHYSAWPDHGVPSKVRPLLDMVRLIRDCQTSETLPVLVHCSAGCGRTGTICAIDYVWGLLRLGKLTPEFSLFYLVREMRRQRIAMVQTKDQYVLVHRAVRELFEEQLKIIDSHPYANVDQNGLPLDIKSDLEEPTYETVEFQSNDDKLKDTAHSSRSQPPSLPPANRDLAVNSKLEKEVENHCKHHEQERHNAQDPIASHSQSLYQRADEIMVLSNDTEEKTEKEKESVDEKQSSPPSKSSLSKTSLLRKPSIVKLKAFFEKSKDDKKSGTTQLSRAKSDVSSRFHSFNNFASSFNRGQTSAVKISAPTSPTAAETAPPEKQKLKPALLAKPALPVKRSKSLKIIKGDTPDGFKVISPSKTKTENETSGMDGTDGLNSSLNSVANPQIPSSSGFSTVTNNPIRVSVKQVEIPKLQKIVSKSVKPEVQIATRHEYRKDSKKSSIEELDSITSTSSKEKFRGILPKKPIVPPKTHILKDSHKYTNVSVTPMRMKMGIAKEMEDAVVKIEQEPKYAKLKKYDTVTPKTLSSITGTSLTRSQSHVWQPSKTQNPIRIFSDENIHHAGSLAERSFPMTNGSVDNLSFRSTDAASMGYDKRVDHSPKDLSYQRKSSLELSTSSTPKSSTSSNGQEVDYPRDRPVVRKRVPKTNPYANYFPSMGSPKYSPKEYSPLNSQQNESCVNSGNGNISGISLGENGSRDLPHLKLSHGRSRENSSESSSNTGTPRSSLPSTPTQTMDPAYTQLIKTNLQGLTSGTKKINGNGSFPPKSILKGSLSSTPSESDERLDSCRIGHQTQGPTIKNNVITAPQKISTVRIAVGVRERRNSFRQAVWKEEQPSLNGISDIKQSPSNPFLFSSNNRQKVELQSSSSTSFPIRSHKDYEPIWPTEPGSSNTSKQFQTGPSSFYVSSEDRYGPSLNKAPTNTSLTFHPTTSAASSSQTRGQNFPNPKRSQSEERTPFGENRLQPGPHNKFEEIQVLLEELKAPHLKQSVHSNIAQGNAHEIDRHNKIEKPSHSSTNLRHQRSLRTQRPQYQQGLSCFTFRKPCSFESITDQLHTEEYQSFTNELSPSSYEHGHSKLNGSSKPGESFVAAAEERHVNDYVSLRNCRTSSQPLTLGSTRREDFSLGETPVPPPRTKRLQHGVKKEPGAYTSKLSDNNASASFPTWTNGVGNQNHSSSSNLPEVVRCTNNYAEDNQPTSDTQTIVHPTSPKAIIRALGLFQAKAANMRSRFAHWTEAKDRTNSTKRSNGTLLTKENDPKDDINNDGGFSPSVTSATQLPHPSRSKHQYL